MIERFCRWYKTVVIAIAVFISGVGCGAESTTKTVNQMVEQCRQLQGQPVIDLDTESVECWLPADQ